MLILNNLISNAIKFSLPGQDIKLIIRSKEDRIIFQLEDEGIGMKEEDLQAILNSDGNSMPGTRNEKGTGLGIAVTLAMVELIHGKIAFESEVSQGTTVTLQLPQTNYTRKTKEKEFQFSKIEGSLV
jgi:signal transduction histidine kinase